MKKAIILPLLLCAGSVFAATPVLPQYDEASLSLMSEDEQAYYLWEQEFVGSLTYQDGLIELPGGLATLQVPENFYYLSPQDAERVLSEGWGNIPSDELPLGMLFPSRYHPMADESWGVTIDYEDEGHVSDKDAHKIDYDDVLSEMISDTNLSSEWRVENGYDSMELLGWAAPPYYDEAGKKIHWAKELRFGDAEYTTLNYNVRVLGREGVLVLNFIANMSQLPEIEQSLGTVMAMPAFTPGNTYAEFDPKMDRVAAYGIGGLVAGKVLAKTGLLAAGLIFLKKFGVFIVVGIAAVGRKVFGRSKA
jgi:uncharacterized membrane-anchored protein